MSDRLAQIIATTKEEVARRKQVMFVEGRDSGSLFAAKTMADAELAFGAEAGLRNDVRGFLHHIRQRIAAGGYALIAEVKKASPSKGLIRADFDPAAHARAYAAGGATCLSVLTDEPYFQGSLAYLEAARGAVNLPVLRKDFMVDPWQVHEERLHGADAILIIVAALEDGQMAEIEAAALNHGMDVLVEVHDEYELDRALRLRSKLIGINNRDLRTFHTDPTRAWLIAARIPADYVVVSESGIATHADLQAAADHGIRCFLVGESLMRQPDIEVATRALLNPLPLAGEGQARIASQGEGQARHG